MDVIKKEEVKTVQPDYNLETDTEDRCIEQMHEQRISISLITDADFENRTSDYEINITNLYNVIKNFLDNEANYSNLTVTGVYSKD